MSRKGPSRRQLLAQSAQVLAGAHLASRTAMSADRIAGANERIAVGVVGTGSRGTTLMNWINRLSGTENVQITAVCDIWNQRREAAQEQVRLATGNKPRACRTLAETCDLQDVDALVIATADFQHAPHARQAVEAGKDVYVEKPFGCDFEQIRLARDAVKKTNRIVQAGTQKRSSGLPWAARDFIRSGRLGKVSYVCMIDSLFQQRWRIPGAENSLSEKDTDWNDFLSYTPPIPFDARKYREFRLFWPFSTGVFCQWMSHSVDLVNLVLGECPKAATAAGGVWVWKDGRTNPDTAQCLIEYPSGCLFSYHMRLGNAADAHGLMFYGTCGTLDLTAGVAYGEGGGGEVFQKPSDSSVPEFSVDASPRLRERIAGGEILKGPADQDHMANFFQAVRSRQTPVAGIDAAFAHSIATTMAGISLRRRMRVEYDPTTDRILLPNEKV